MASTLWCSRFFAASILSKHDRTTLIVPYDVERVLANIDADHGDRTLAGLLRHGVLLVFAAPSQLLSLAGLGWSTAGPSH
jgi:hypothetical protein